MATTPRRRRQTNALTLIDLTQQLRRADVRAGQSAAGRGVRRSTIRRWWSPPRRLSCSIRLVGTTQVLQTIAQVATNAIPQPPASFPGNIVQASVATSRDGLTIAGFGGYSPYLLFRYNVVNHSHHVVLLRFVAPRPARAW